MNKAQQASVELRAMDELAAQDSPMHRLSPLSKLFVTVLYIVVTVSFHKYDISGVFVMVLFPLVGYQVSMIPVHTCFHKLRVVMPLVCAVGLFNPFFDKQIVLYIGTVGVSGGVLTTVDSVFSAAGVNQTTHRIEMTITVDLFIAVPTAHTSVQVETPFVIAESVLLGKVPDAYTVVTGDDQTTTGQIFDYGAERLQK